MDELLENYRKERFSDQKMDSYSSQHIQSLIREGSDKRLGKIKLNIKIELLLAVIISLAVFFFVWLNFIESWKLIYTAFIVTLTSTFYFLLYRRIKGLSFTKSDVKTSLQQAIDYLESTFKLYYRMTVFGFPSLYFGFLIPAHYLKYGSFSGLLEENILLLLIGLGISITLPPTTRWIIKYVYQKHIDELKTNLNILKN